MRKRLLPLLFLFSSCLLYSCSNGSDEDDYDDPIYLEKDTSSSYDFAESSNENGSMNYEIFVRSFYDSNGDGIGDLNGVKAKLPYLSDMGFKSLWLMPIFPSPSYHGYDVIDYYGVNPDYGSLDDFSSLVAEANKYNIDIMLDMVFNHCSIKNNYFIEALEAYKNGDESEDSKANWFNFGPGGDHIIDGIQYESRFDANMPDFNLDCPGVREEIEKISKFWIEKGVKGFRLDAVLYYYYQSTDKNVAFLNWLSDTVHKYDEDFYMVGEAWVSDGLLNNYFGSSCDSFFRFGTASGGSATTMINMVKGYGFASNFAEEVENNETAIHKKNADAYSSYFLSNHDQDRVAKNFASSLDAYKAAASLYALMPGTSYTYYGEEIALKGRRETSPDDQSDVRRRLPMIWSKSDKSGECSFPEKNRQDLNDNAQVEDGVYDLLSDPWSLTSHYKKVIHLRNKYPFIKHAQFISRCAVLNSDEKSVLAYSLTCGEESITIVHNFSNYNVELDAPASSIVDSINTIHRLPSLKDGKLRLGAYSSVIMK